MTPKPPSFKAELKALILRALQASYTSVSVKDGVETGNRYQSLMLGDERTPGFRSHRRQFLDRIDFEGKRVLDLGSNMGEISREARQRAAALVDGFEYDSFFVEIAQAVNAYNGVTRVSFFERDITDPRVYRDHYDVVLAFSVYIYLEHVLSNVADITDGILLLETHQLSHNLETTYLDPIGSLFPYHIILGASDWGKGANPDGERAVIAFAKTDQALRSYVRGIDSRGQFGPGRRLESTPDIRPIDVARTPWYDRFYGRFGTSPAETLLNTISEMEIDVDELAGNGDLASNDLAGWVYWLVYLKGALQASGGASTGSQNAYYSLLEKHWKNDPRRANDLSDADRLSTLVCSRFQDFELFRGDPDAPKKVEPIQLIVTDGPPVPLPTQDVKRIYSVGSEVPVETTVIDGYHRLFLARLFGLKEMPGDFVAGADAIPEAEE